MFPGYDKTIETTTSNVKMLPLQSLSFSLYPSLIRKDFRRSRKYFSPVANCRKRSFMTDREKPLDSNQMTRTWFDELLVEMRHFDAVVPDTELVLYGETFRTPVMTAALSHLKGKNGSGDGMVQMAEGAKAAGAVNWAGMGEPDQFDAIARTGARSIKIIKPYANERDVITRLEGAEAAGALAVGMDLDHSFSGAGYPDQVMGHSMRPRTLEEISGYVRRTNLPFIIKGVLSTEDARKCIDAGVRGIVVSHHHGIMASAVPPLMILPEIVRVVDGAFPIFVDCGISNGMDAFKALALGATAVCVGRPVMNAIRDNGADGAADVINTVTDELRGVMAHTATRDIRHIDPSLIWHRSGRRLF